MHTPSHDLSFPSECGQLQTVSGVRVNVQVVKTHVVDPELILVSPSFVKNLVKIAGDDDCCIQSHQWYLKPLPLAHSE